MHQVPEKQVSLELKATGAKLLSGIFALAALFEGKLCEADSFDNVLRDTETYLGSFKLTERLG
jgi:hypothetical protein